MPRREWPRFDSGLRRGGVSGLRASEVAAGSCILGLLWAKGEGPPPPRPPSGRRHPGKGSFSLADSVAANARAPSECDHAPCQPSSFRAALICAAVINRRSRH